MIDVDSCPTCRRLYPATKGSAEMRLHEATEALRRDEHLSDVLESVVQGMDEPDYEFDRVDDGQVIRNVIGALRREALRADVTPDLYDAFCAWYEEHEITSDVERRLADTLALHLGIGQLAHPAPLDRGDKS